MVFPRVWGRGGIFWALPIVCIFANFCNASRTLAPFCSTGDDLRLGFPCGSAKSAFPGARDVAMLFRTMGGEFLGFAIFCIFFISVLFPGLGRIFCLSETDRGDP